MKKLTITILLLTAVIISGCLTKTQTPLNDNQNANATPIATTTEEIDTSDWKTYRNEEYGFEFKYPGSYISDKAYSIWTLDEGKGAVNLKKEWGINWYQEGLFSVSVYEMADKQRVLDYFNYKLSGEVIHFSTYMGKKLDYSHMLIERGNFIYIFGSSFMNENFGDNKYIQLHNEYNNILRTFIFLD